MGLITQEERHEAVIDKWNEATEEVAEAMDENLDDAEPHLHDGQLGRPRLVQADPPAGRHARPDGQPEGRDHRAPDQGQLHGGPDVLEYFISTHGARKGLADTALRTADSGYLTRRLVDVAQDVIIRERGLRHRGVHRAAAAQGRRASRTTTSSAASRRPTIATKRGRVARREAPGDRPRRARRDRSRRSTARTASTVPVRSVLKCEATSGVCQACYGRSMASGKTAQIGDAVGIIAAQSIGEPGTQLTMRTFHTGGVAGADITHGLPRVVELFEARKPKGLAKIAEVPARSRRGDRQGAHRRHHRRRRRGAPLHVPAPHAPARRARARRSRPATQLNEGSLYPHELLALGGAPPSGGPELYLVKEVQEVYKSQGVDINDKHIELIVRQMLKKVRVDQKGDTNLPAGAVRRPLRVPARSTTRSRGQGRDGAVRGDHPRHHEGLAEHGLVPVGGLLPGDDEGADRRGARGQDRPPQRPQGERDHRQADPGRHGPQALPADRDRAGRAAPPRDRRRRPARGRDSPPSSGSATATACAASARRSTRPSSRRSAPASADRGRLRRPRRPRRRRPAARRRQAQTVDAG